jgi:hypothetical protein
MWTGGTFINGLTTPTYNDSTGKMSMSLSQDLQSTASPQFVGLTLTGDLDVRGGNLTTSQTTFNLLNSTATTVNFAGSATTIEIGSSSGTTNINNSLDVDGDINIDGGDLTVSSSDFNLANTNATTVNFAGAATAVNIGNSSGAINSAGDLNIATGKEYKINNVSILNATTLGSSVISSSLTSVGTITTGTWSAAAIAANKGGTGQTSYAIGDILYASSSSALAKLAGVVTGNVLISGGIESAPSWGKVGLNTHISGTLAVANGGTGVTTSTGTGSVALSESPTFTGIPLSPTAEPGTNTTQIATTQFVQSAISSITSPLPSQTGNGGKLLTTDGTNASWTNVVDCGTP